MTIGKNCKAKILYQNKMEFMRENKFTTFSEEEEFRNAVYIHFMN